MTRKQKIQEDYFNYLCGLVGGEENAEHSFHRRQLLRYLNCFEFIYSIPRDGNRYDDGVNLRYRFGYETGVDARDIATCLDIYPCSVLEMMIALCLRCEEQIMCNEEAGNRTGEWFDAMLKSLGLREGMREKTVGDILTRFVNHHYEPNGKGGLFTLKQSRHDMRNAEIWYQAMWYFDEVLQKGQ